MFTPQRKGWSLAPRTTAERKKSPLRGSGPRVSSGRGKGPAEAGASLPPPPKDLLSGHGYGDVGGGADGEVEVWRKFKEAGMLDEAEMERKDREALVERIERLEGELYDYQYNMGLLLMEKKDWSAKHEDLNLRLLEADEMLKREKAASLVALSENEKREENLKKALDVEKQCVHDLEKALRELRAGQAEVKLTSDQKLADAHTLMANIEAKSLEVELKLRSADAKEAEISRKNAELERKSQELSSRERVIQRDYASLNAEKESFTENVARQRDELRAWEKSLQDGRDRLVEGQNFLNQREQKVNENEKNLFKKEKELDTMQEPLEKKAKSLKEKEDYINVRLTALADKEKEIEMATKNLEKKEKDLLDLEQKLATREEVGMKKLLDEHNSSLASKRHEFEMEMETKRRSLEGEFKDKLNSLEKKETEIVKKGEQLAKREQALEKKAEKLKDDQQKLSLQMKDLKKREEANKANEVELQRKANQISEETQQLQLSVNRNEAIKKDIESQKATLAAERENLKVTEQERADFVESQLRLKLESEDCRVFKETLIREREELRQERENFEKEWEALDDKRAALAVTEKLIGDEKATLDKWKHNEEEKLRIAQLESRNQIQQALEELKLKEEAFEETMKHERSQLHDKIQQEHDENMRKFDTLKHQLEIDMQKKLEESENRLEVEVAKFNELKETEMKQINSLRESIALESQRTKVEHDKLEREKQEYLLQRDKLEEAQNEIRTDVETLQSLSRNLKIQREELIKERENFLAITEKYKSCQNCGVTISEFVAPLLRPVDEIEDPETAPLPSLVNAYIENQLKAGKLNQSPANQNQSAGSKVAWIFKACKERIRSFSPGKKVVEGSSQPNEISEFGDQLDEAALLEGQKGPILTDHVQSDSLVGATEASGRVQSDPEPSHAKEDNSMGILRDEPATGVKEVASEIAVHSVGRQDETNSLPPLPEKTPTPKKPKAKVQRRGRGKGLKRTRSVQAVVEESQSLLKEPLEEEKHVENNNPLSSSGNLIDVDKRPTGVGHKRHRAETSVPTASEVDGSGQAHSESVSLGGRRKRRQTVASETIAGGKHYNLRKKSTILGSRTTGAKAGSNPEPPVPVKSKDVIEGKKDFMLDNKHLVPPLDEVDKQVLVLQSESIEIYEQSMQVEAGDNSELNRNAEAAASSTPENGSSLAEESEDNSGEESDSEKYNVSFGKKIWNFFTS